MYSKHVSKFSVDVDCGLVQANLLLFRAYINCISCNCNMLVTALLLQQKYCKYRVSVFFSQANILLNFLLSLYKSNVFQIEIYSNGFI